jgi:hypothetical protein
MSSTDDNAHPPMRLIKRRVLINSADRVSGNQTNYVIELKPPLQNIVSIDWAYTSLTNYLLVVDEFSKTGYTSGNVPYWRNLGESVNNRYEQTQEAFELPRTYNRLTFHWRNYSGTDPAFTNETTLELVCWEKT